MFDEANTTTLPKNCGTSPSFTVCTADRKVVNPTANTSDNRLSLSDNYAYDYAGNTTADAQGRTFIYDAENKQTKVTNSSGTLGEYLYDGDGKRVKKVSAAEETIFVYDAQGKMIAEYSTALNPTPQVSYLTADHLGSPRINTDEKGAVIARHDYQPFGEEINDGRNTGLQYQADAVRKQFTGYEKDKETDLDFAQARYLDNKLGRFNSVDPLYLELKRLIDPQQLNLYSYAVGNPIKFTDSTGLSIELKCDNSQNCITATNDFNNRKDKKFEVSLGKDGKLKVDGKVDVKKLSKSEKALYNAINDKKNNATINVVGDTGRQEFGLHDDKGKNTVDLENLSKLDSPRNKGGLSSGDVLAHEALDSYFSLSMDADTADIEAARLYPGLYIPTDNQNIYTNSARTDLLGMIYNQRISDGSGSLQVTVKYDTPIPAIDLDPRFNSKEQIKDNTIDARGRVTDVKFVSNQIKPLKF